jgi:DNA-binding NtrC family response regulator
MINLPLENKNILIIDDARPPRKILKKLLQNFGNCNFQEEENLSTVKISLETKCFDLIFCDLHLQGETSMSLLEWIKKDITNKNSKTPIIIISSDLDKESLIKGRSIGVSNFLVKPFNMGDLSRVLISTLNWPESIRKHYE